MNICILGAHIPPVMGGIEIHMWELAKHLAAEGHIVFLLGSSEPEPYDKLPGYELREGVKIFRIGFIPGFRRITRALSAMFCILALHRKYGLDALHCHYLYPIGIVGAFINIVSGIPVVVTEHGSIIDERKSWWKRLVMRRVGGRIKRIITPSNELRNICLSINLPAEKVVNISNAVDTDRFRPLRSVEIRKRYGIRDEEIVALSLRRLVPKTGVQYLIEAAKYIVEKFKRVRFLIVGSPVKRSFLDKLRNRVMELKLEKYFVFTDAVDNNRVTEYIAASDLAVFPSLAEATSIACLEIMAMGKAVVASSVGGLTEIIEHDRDGLLVDFGREESSYSDWGVPEETIIKLAEAVMGLINDENKRKRLGDEARRTVESKFSWKNYIKQVTAIYRNE